MRTARTASVLSVVFLTLSLAPLPPGGDLAAQRAPSEFVRALAQNTLLRMVAEDTTSVMEGGMPARWRALLPVPAGARVLGTVFTDSAASAYLLLPLAPDSAEAALDRAARAQGWTPIPRFTPRRGGFLPQQTAGRTPEYCRGARRLLAFSQKSAGRTLLQVTYMSARGMMEACGALPREPPGNPYAVLPALEAPPLPPGARPMACQVAYSNSASTSTRLETPLPNAEVLAFYGKQLEAAGWAPVVIGESARGSWTRATPGGDTARVDLVVHASVEPKAPDCREVELRVLRSRF